VDDLLAAEDKDLERLERGRRDRLARHIEFLDRAEALAKPLPEPGGGTGQSGQHILARRDLLEFASEALVVPCIDGLQREHVDLAEFRYRTGDECFEILPHADLLPELFGNPLVGAPAHEAKGLADLGIGNDIEKRRLRE